MSFSQCFISIVFVALCLVLPGSGEATTVQRRKVINPTILVDQSGNGNFTTIQSAINSIPSYNKEWIRIQLKAGTYREKVQIPYDKPFIYLRGEGMRKTYIVWDDYESIQDSATFTFQADNIIVKHITFINSYNSAASGSRNPMAPALAARIQGDKTAFYRCGFLGLQDTLWDDQGRHYFKNCIIEGAVDFIFGGGQSLYEQCTISVNVKALNGVPGCITAHSRTYLNETSGFVFKDCNIVGNGKTFLGRAWRQCARVVLYNTSMQDIIVPEGWDAWFYTGHEHEMTFAEYNCRGLGADTSGRVNWANKLSPSELDQLISTSFIDDEGWLSSLDLY